MEKSADEITIELVEWLMTVTPGVPANAPALNTPLRKTGIDVRLARATPRPATRGASTPLTIDLDYLVTVQLAEAAAEQHTIAELMFAAMARQDVEVLGGDEAARVAAALGMTVSPGFILRVPLVRERQRRPDQASRARPPAGATAAALQSLIRGRVVGPADEPVEGASVEAAGVEGAVRTDSTGRFRIATGNPDGAAVKLVARSEGVEVEAVAVAGLPVTLRLPPKS